MGLDVVGEVGLNVGKLVGLDVGGGVGLDVGKLVGDNVLSHPAGNSSQLLGPWQALSPTFTPPFLE